MSWAISEVDGLINLLFDIWITEYITKEQNFNKYFAIFHQEKNLQYHKTLLKDSVMEQYPQLSPHKTMLKKIVVSCSTMEQYGQNTLL